MRSLLILAFAATTASANSGSFDVSSLPQECRAVAAVPVHRRDDGPLYAAMTSAASCAASVRMAQVKVEPTDASARALGDAVAPSLALLDQVIASGDRDSKIIALHAKGDLLSGIAIRLTGAVQLTTDQAAYTRRTDDALALARPWLDKGSEAFAQLARLAQNAAAEPNAVVAYDVHDPRVTAARVSRR